MSDKFIVRIWLIAFATPLDFGPFDAEGAQALETSLLKPGKCVKEELPGRGRICVRTSHIIATAVLSVPVANEIDANVVAEPVVDTTQPQPSNV